MTPQDTMRLALRALETGLELAEAHAEHTHTVYAGYYPERHKQVDTDVAEIKAAIEALKAALAQQVEADPNAPWMTEAHMLCTDHGIPQGNLTERIRALRDKLAQQVEPVAWRVWSPDGTNVYQYSEDGDGEPLYTAPQARQEEQSCTSTGVCVRSGLYVPAPQAQPVAKTPPEWWPAVENILTEYGLAAISFVADFKKASGDYLAQIKQDISAPQAQQPIIQTQIVKDISQAQQEPVAWCELSLDGKHIAFFDGKPIIMVGPVGNDCHQTPLYAAAAPAAQQGEKK